MSDITRETLEWAVEHADLTTQEIDNRQWIKSHYSEVIPPQPSMIRFFSLTSFCEFVLMQEERDAAWIHVTSPIEVEFLGILNDRKKREGYATAVPMIDGAFIANQYMGQEAFITSVQAFFEDSEDRRLLLKICGNIRSGQHVTLEDDGITQRVQTAAGVVSQAMEEMPNPVTLYPFETFPEIEAQPRKYIMRFRGDEEKAATFALHPIPDPVYSADICTAIKYWLKTKLPDHVILG